MKKMRLIIDGDYNKDLITLIKREKLPVSHIILHVPENPFGNGSIFLPKKLPTFKDFEEYTRIVQKNGIIPIAGIDSTCQGNLEAHIKHYEAINSLFQKLQELNYKDILVSSPNNVAFVNANYPQLKIYLSYSQYVTSLNRGKIFFNIGTDSIILHPDVLRYVNLLKGFQKLKEKMYKDRKKDYILPVNIGCNWGCIHWYQHHNLQSHRTLNSPILSNQETISNVENGFDYPLLSCWKKRLEQPVNLLKAGWISPHNIEFYEKLGYDTFLLCTSGFSSQKILEIIRAYVNRSYDKNFNEILNIPQPYGDYWPKDKIKNSILQLDPAVIKEFCNKAPTQVYYPSESEINAHCNEFLKKLSVRNVQEKDNIVQLITEKMQMMRTEAIKR